MDHRAGDCGQWRNDLESESETGTGTGRGQGIDKEAPLCFVAVIQVLSSSSLFAPFQVLFLFLFLSLFLFLFLLLRIFAS
jgi:hypothetical protein